MSVAMLGEYCDLINGGAWSEKEYMASGLPVLKVSNCKTSGFQLGELDYLPYTAKEKYKQNSLQLYDVIIATVGSHPNLVDSAAGRSCVVTDEVAGFYLNQNAVCLRTKDDAKLNQRYLAYLAQSFEFKHYIQSRGKGAANQMRIAIGAIKEYQWNLPDIKTQQSIADTLSAYDDLIENNRKQIKLSEEAAQRLYQEWFVDLRFPGHEHTPITEGIPEAWRNDRINTIVSLLSGFAFKSDDFVDDGKYKIVTIKNVKDGFFDRSNVSCISAVPTKMPNHCILHDGDILLSLTGNVGRTCMVNGSNYLLNQRVAKLHSDYPSFAYCLFRSKDIFDKMNTLANGVAQQNLSPIKTGEIKIKIPDDKVLQAFEDTVSPMLQKIVTLNHACTKLTETRDRLLPKLMSG